MRRIVLGSTSLYRKTLMEKLGMAFEVLSPLLDEEKAKFHLEEKKVSPLTMAQSLARLKAESLQADNRLVIGGDQLVHIDGKILGKPHSFERAVLQLESMNNKTHEIITAVCLATNEKNYEIYDIAQLTMKNLTREEIENYVRLDQPFDCAGSYKIEKNGKSLFKSIVAQDLSAIEGLPLIKLSQILQTLGYETKKI
jgi:septum formation protein